MARFDEWFNPYSVEHMQAYAHLCKTGMWPEGFVPADVEVSPLFVAEIHAKMATAWLNAASSGHIPGVPEFEV